VAEAGLINRILCHAATRKTWALEP